MTAETNSHNRSITQSSNRSMFWRLWRRSLTVKRPQAGLAIASVLMGAAVASLLLNLYSDVRRKMTQEFRAYGPNVVLAPEQTARNGPAGTDSGAPTELMNEESTGRMAPVLARVPGASAVPVLYVVVGLKRVPADPRLPEIQNLVAAGADFAELWRLNPSWHITGGAPAQAGGAVVGSHAAALLHLAPGDSIELSPLGVTAEQAPERRQTYGVAGILSTGASEDDQVFVPLPSLQRIADRAGRISLIELSLPGDAAEIERTSRELTVALPGVEARPVRQIVYSSGKVLGTIRWLTVSLTVLILIIIALSVTATMTTIVLERQKDVATMKALGASDSLVMRLFLSEGAGLGLAGGLIGFALGLVLARGVAARLFGVSLNPAWWTLPAVALAGTVLAIAATLVPVSSVRRVQPATVLKGE